MVIFAFTPLLLILPAIFNCVSAAPCIKGRALHDGLADGHQLNPEEDYTTSCSSHHTDLQWELYSHASTSHVPAQYTRHSSHLFGAATAHVTHMHQYASWRISLNGVSDPRFFGNVHQHWNAEHKLAKKIFGHGLPSEVLLHGIHKAHHVLYHKGTADVHGNLIWAGDLLDIFKAGTIDNRLRPVLYTYVIDDSDMWKFSETGAALSVNVVSKHILHSAASPTIRYSGEFHWRPVVDGYWSGLHGTNALEDASTQWELVIDNNSGTYAPDKRLLPNLKALLEFNFPGLRVVALEHEDPALKLSKEALAEYARRQRHHRPGLEWGRS